jgi:hypothetical protein
VASAELAPIDRHMTAHTKRVRLILAGLLTGKHASREHIWGMDQILPPGLNDLEFEALRQLAAHPTTFHIPSDVESGLKNIGYAKEVLGGIVLTKDGL